MTVRRVLIACEGKHESGSQTGVALQPEGELPALPRLIHRVLAEPSAVEYTCTPFSKVRHVPGKGHKWGRKVKRLILLAKADEYDAVVVLIDRDRKKNQDRLEPLKQARDEMMILFQSCAVGTAIETFDAWMICDENAIENADGDKSHCHTTPESLAGKEGSGKHPKDRAARIFGSGKGLANHYQTIAEHIDMNRLAERCPDGFAPFRKDVESRIVPLFK
ncbi:MAG: DUF4276 family protein [Phycisphaerae bacterium]|nr:DUF4276 family protein [Phycisphaerae bacterium]